MQISQGDNTTERPMWAEKGGLDFEGRARWDAWTNFKVSTPPFLIVLAAAQAAARRCFFRCPASVAAPPVVARLAGRQSTPPHADPSVGG